MRAFYPFLIGIAVLWALPRNAHAQHLYVTNVRGTAVVSEYNAITGEVINANLITGLIGPGTGLAVTGPSAFFPSATLFVADAQSGTVGKYDANTGVAIDADFVKGLVAPYGLAVGGNTLFVANHFGDTVGKYDATTGVAINASFIMRLEGPDGLALSGNTLFVANSNTLPGTGFIGEYDASTGEAIDARFIKGLTSVRVIAVNSAK